MYSHAQEGCKKASDSPGAGVKSDCGLISTSAGKGTWVLRKNAEYSYQLIPLSSSEYSNFLFKRNKKTSKTEHIPNLSPLSILHRKPAGGLFSSMLGNFCKARSPS